MADPLAAAESELYGLPLEDFTKARDAMARRLRKDDRELAAAVGKLGKPTPVGWAVNRLARDEPALIEALIDAGDRLREAQLGGADREALREAVAEERSAVEAVLAAARGLEPGGRALSRPMTDRLRATLHAAAGDEEVRERIRAGRLVDEAQAGGAWPLGAVPAKPRARKAAPKKAERDEEAEAREAAEREAAEREAAERRELEKRLKRARREADAAGRRLDTARAEAEAARERLEAAEREHEAARDEVARLEERL